MHYIPGRREFLGCDAHDILQLKCLMVKMGIGTIFARSSYRASCPKILSYSANCLKICLDVCICKYTVHICVLNRLLNNKSSLNFCQYSIILYVILDLYFYCYSRVNLVFFRDEGIEWWLWALHIVPPWTLVLKQNRFKCLIAFVIYWHPHQALYQKCRFANSEGKNNISY